MKRLWVGVICNCMYDNEEENIRLELCLSTFVYPCGPAVRVVDLRPRV